MKMYVSVDDGGFPTAFYSSELHGDAVPYDAVELTEAQYQEFINNSGLRRLVGEEVVVFDPPPPPPPDPPLPALTRRQLRLGLLSNGITTTQVEAVIAAIPDEIDREMAQIEWADASTYSRDHPLVNQIGAEMSLTPEQIDAMWLAAEAL